jgi:hypothetical protein
MKPLNRDSQLFFCGHHVSSYVSLSNFEPPLPNSDFRVLKATMPSNIRCIDRDAKDSTRMRVSQRHIND